MVLNSPLDTEQPIILGFDPGRHKCGLAAMGVDRTLHYHQVIAADEVIDTIQQLQKQLPISIVVMGDQTSAKTWKQKLSHDLPELRVVLVDERYSSLEARDRYWKMYPPKGMYRLIPQGMRTPPRSLDDIVAILLIERYLGRLVAAE